MAFLKNTFSPLAFMLVILIVYVFARTNASPLDIVCNQVSDRSFCVNNFGANPRTWNADLSSLGHIAIVKATITGTAINKTIDVLRLKAVDPQLKHLLAQCEHSYIGALNALRIAPYDLKNEKYRELRLHAGKAMDAAVRCESSFTSPFKSPLTVENVEFKNFCDILGVIADDLNAGKKNSFEMN